MSSYAEISWSGWRCRPRSQVVSIHVLSALRGGLSPDLRQCAWKGFPEEVASKPTPQDSGNQPREVAWEKDRDERILWDEWLHALRPGELREPGALRLVAQCGWKWQI